MHFAGAQVTALVILLLLRVVDRMVLQLEMRWSELSPISFDVQSTKLTKAPK